jgi:hypothetical protein
MIDHIVHDLHKTPSINIMILIGDVSRIDRFLIKLVLDQVKLIIVCLHDCRGIFTAKSREKNVKCKKNLF